MEKWYDIIKTIGLVLVSIVTALQGQEIKAQTHQIEVQNEALASIHLHNNTHIISKL